jgi:hypothetical protein
MKLKLISLFAAISMLVLVAGAGAQDSYYVAKVKPKLTLKVKPKRDKSAPFKFAASGKLNRKGVSKSKGCKGKVTITLRKGKATASAKAKVKGNCTYSKRFTVKKPGKYKVSAKFGGNARLKKASAKPVTVRAG